MFNQKLTSLLATATTALLLTACGGDDGGSDTSTTNSTLPTTGTSATDDASGTSTTTTSTTTDATSTTTTTDTGMDTGSTGSGSCTPDDECQTDADCGPGGSCVGCICLGGTDTGGGECVAPTCDACGDCMMCLNCAQGMGGDCFDENQACNMNAECMALIGCANMCMDQQCIMDCQAMHPDGVDDFNALIGCLFPVMGGPCATSCV